MSISQSASRRGSGWRLAALEALVLFGTLVALLTEFLSAMRAVRRGPLLAAWALICAGALVRGVFRHRARPSGKPSLLRLGIAPAILLACVAAIAGILGFIALRSPPNSSDAMTYHLSRVVHWAQAESVAFFPTPYYPEIMLSPLAEYTILHSYVLTGGDHYANLVQFLGLLGSLLGVSLIAERLGAQALGQVGAVVFCATIPNGILQATGVKNDYYLTLWLVAMVYFAIVYGEAGDRAPATWMGLSLGLALFTKGTAYVLAPPLLLAVLVPALRKRRVAMLRAAPIVLAGVLLINGPQYWRNVVFSGSPIGFRSAHGDGRFRWSNDRFGFRTTLSNALRSGSEHLAARSEGWNQGVYNAVVRMHRALGMDPNDPATTWLWISFQPPVNANHEANAPNRWQLALLALAGIALAWRWRRASEDALRWFYLSLPVAFLLFCTVFRWQPYLGRMHLPLFVLGSAVFGVLAERLLPRAVVVLLCLFLLNNARPYVFENWVRPLKGPRSLLHTKRDLNYFADMRTYTNPDYYLKAVERTLQSGCTRVGLDTSIFQLEYPYEALLLERNPNVRFRHVGVKNQSSRYDPGDGWTPCAVLCLNCAGNQEEIEEYRPVGAPRQLGTFLLFVVDPEARPQGSASSTAALRPSAM